MARKQETKEEWISSQQAAAMLTENSGHLISSDYVRQLGRNGKISTKTIDLRTKLYSRAEVESYIVKKKGDGSVRREARAPRGQGEKAIA
jgi:hypothetical protein